jgi:hypothetical protein
MPSHFRCITEQEVEIDGKRATVKASVYRASQEERVRSAALDPALLRYYEIRFMGEAAHMLVSEVELRSLLGEEQFGRLP